MGLDSKIMCHELNIKEGSSKQKSRLHIKVLIFGVVGQRGIGKKVEKGMEMCVDFTDLKKACPKDNHPLPKH